MDEDFRKIQLESIKILLRPIITFCIRYSCPIQDFYNVAKIVFLECAEAEIRRTSDKVNPSRLSVLTGLHRKDVTRLYHGPKTIPEDPASVLTKVMGQWRHDRRFATKAGNPRVLSYLGDGTEFWKLVKSVSQNVNPGTVLFELKRRGFVSETPRGLKLELQLFSVESDPRAGFSLLAKEVDSLIQSVHENILRQNKVSNLHIRTEYTSIFPRDVSKIKTWLIREGKAFHKKVRRFLSRFDVDLNPSVKKQVGAEASEVVSVSTFCHVKSEKS